MSTALGLAMQISANTAQLAQAVQDVNAKLESMGAAGKKASDDLSTLKNIEIGKLALGGLKAAGEAFISFGSAVFSATKGLVDFGKRIADELDALNDVANRTGVGVEALQAYGGAAKLAGTDIETFAKSIQKLTVNIGKAVGDEKAQEAFEKLGISFEELRTKTPTEQFEMIADAISRISDPAERAAAAVKLFGKGGIELGPLFADGPGALARMREEAVALGQVVSGDSIKSIAAMNDAFDKVWMTVKGLTGQIVGELAGPIGDIANDLLRVVKEVGATNIAQNVAAGLIDFIKMAGNAFFTLAKFIEEFVKKFAPILGLELRTEEQKARDEEINRLRKAVSATVGGYGMGASIDPETRRQLERNKEAQRQRLAQLEAQVAAENASGILSVVQANFNRSLDAAASSLDQRMQAARSPSAVTANGGQVVEFSADTVAGAIDELKDPLNIIARYARPPDTVEIPR